MQPIVGDWRYLRRGRPHQLVVSGLTMLQLERGGWMESIHQNNVILRAKDSFWIVRFRENHSINWFTGLIVGSDRSEQVLDNLKYQIQPFEPK